MVFGVIQFHYLWKRLTIKNLMGMYTFFERVMFKITPKFYFLLYGSSFSTSCSPLMYIIQLHQIQMNCYYFYYPTSYMDTMDFNIWNFFSRMFHISGIVVLSFFVCWAPFHAQRLGYIYFGGLDTSIPENLILVETFYDVNETLM